MTGLALALALLAAQALPEAPPESVATTDIVVLSKKLDSVVFKWNAREADGIRRMAFCTIVRSSGDNEVDAITCRATEACLPLIPRIRRQRQSLFDKCLTDTRHRMVSELFDSRALAMAAAGAGAEAGAAQ